MSFTILFSVLLCCCPVFSLDYLAIVEDYVRNVKGFSTLTTVSCPFGFDFNALAEDKGFMFQNLDFSTGLYIPEEENCRQLIVLDLSCPGALTVLQELSDQQQFNSFYRNFFLFNAREEEFWFEEELRPTLTNLEFTFVSNVAVGTKFMVEGSNSTTSPFDGEFFIYELWNPGKKQGGRLKMDLVGSYNNRGSYTALVTSPLIQSRLDLSELRLECAIVTTNPFNDTLEGYLLHSYSPYFDTVHRLNFRTISLVRDYFGFKLHVKRTGSWGYVQNSSSGIVFDGMVGMIQRGEVDFGCSPAWFRLERLLVADYAAQTWAIRPIFLFRHPNTRGLGRNVFLEPFDDTVWVVLLVSSVIIILLMANTVQQEKGLLAHDIEERKEILLFNVRFPVFPLYTLRDGVKSLFQSARIYISVILQQGIPTSDEGHLISSKFAVFLLFSYSFLLFQFYAASIVGSLLMTPPKIIKTIPDLTRSRLQVGIQDIVYNYDFFKHTKDENALELYAKKVKVLDKRTGNYSLNFYSVDEGLRKLQFESFAFHVDLDYVFQRIIDKFNEKDICDLTMINLYPQQAMGNVFPKGSAFRHVLNYGVHRAIESGLFSREKNFWVAKTPVCTRQIQSEDLQVELFPLMSLFWIFLGGALLSVILLAVEIVVHRITE